MIDGPIIVHPEQVQQHREAGRSLDERADRGPVQPDDEVTPSALARLGRRPRRAVR
jgi:hypothetical protein